jgi:hypothetical protein
MTTQIKNTNANGQYHGYNEFIFNVYNEYISDDLKMGRGNFVNGKVIGYEEYHPWKETTYYIR